MSQNHRISNTTQKSFRVAEPGGRIQTDTGHGGGHETLTSSKVDMIDTTISFESQDQIRALFGPGDEYLRLVRETIGIDVVLRGDELRLQGEPDRVDKAREVFGELREIIERKRYLPKADLHRVLRGETDETTQDAGADMRSPGIDLHEKSRRIKPRTEGQGRYIRAIRDHDLVFCCGPAGCGKTYLAVAMAINALRSEQVRRIVLVRPAVEAGEKLGFLPGDLLAKVDPFLRPLLDALNDMLDFEAVKRYMESDVIEVVPLAFMRGRTLNDTFVILDEGQNTTVTQMKMFLTRMGASSKIVVTGDITQNDLESHVKSGLTDAVERLGHIDGVAAVELTGQDIVRHRLVREIVSAYDENQERRPALKG